MQAFLLIFSNVILVVIGQTFIKKGVNSVGSFTEMPFLSFLITTFTTPLILIGISLYADSSVIWLMALSKVNLSVAYPALSMGYVLIILSSWLFLHESIGIIKLLGVAFICLGVILVFRA